MASVSVKRSIEAYVFLLGPYFKSIPVVLVSKGILEKSQFLVGLPDKTCIGFESDIFSDWKNQCLQSPLTTT